MGTGEQRMNEIGEIAFRGRVGQNVADYARANQRFAHDMAQELVNGAEAAARAMRKLDGHPGLFGVDVRLRARRVARKLRKAEKLALGVSAEVVRFNQQYRREFLEPRSTGGSKNRRWHGGVDL
ncbi:hypothetical protein [Actinomadura rugatobispora]|uniref:Uncharacterized protein n=1 Tax=Actinomadura rugatobispora TaxID=1994 RepID=A0ABW0ZQ07_9ACTN|nr:hypothetical protein GCM10010200_036750 [Actinomadura rugatobispora]